MQRALAILARLRDPRALAALAVLAGLAGVSISPTLLQAVATLAEVLLGGAVAPL